MLEEEVFLAWPETPRRVVDMIIVVLSSPCGLSLFLVHSGSCIKVLIRRVCGGAKRALGRRGATSRAWPREAAVAGSWRCHCPASFL